MSNKAKWETRSWLNRVVQICLETCRNPFLLCRLHAALSQNSLLWWMPNQIKPLAITIVWQFIGSVVFCTGCCETSLSDIWVLYDKSDSKSLTNHVGTLWNGGHFQKLRRPGMWPVNPHHFRYSLPLLTLTLLVIGLL